MATSDSNPAARKKSIYALSSAVRNYQPAMNELVKALPEGYPTDKTDASDMEAVDVEVDMTAALLELDIAADIEAATLKTRVKLRSLVLP